MGSCFSYDDIDANQETTATTGCHHSILLHPETSQNGTTYSVTYRPPNLHERLAPGESRPRFWMNSSDNEKSSPIVSVTWSQTNKVLSSRLQRRSNVKRSNTCSTGKKGDESQSNADVKLCPLAQTQYPLSGGDNNSLVIPTYPQFMVPFINKVIRVRLVSLDQRARELVGAYCHLKQGRYFDPSVETSCLIRNMHSLRMTLRYSSAVKGLPEVTLEENHGGLKRLKKVRYRPMPVTWIDVDHRKGCFRAVGESFQLLLEAPSPQLNVEDFPDGNGEMPSALGVYTRHLDTSSSTKLRFSATVFSWYNQSVSDGDHGALESGTKDDTASEY